MPRIRARRSTALMVALCCVVAAPVQAAPAGPGAQPNASEAAEARGQALAKEGKYREAAGALAEALRGVPNEATNRLRRSQLVIEAVNAYKLAFLAAPTECAPMTAGLALADDYLKGLITTYGAGAMVEEDYGAVSSQRNKLDELRRKHSCAEPEPAVTPTVDPGPPPEVKPTPEGPPPGAEPPKPGVASDTPPPPRSRVRAYGAGLGVSAGLTVGMAIGAGVLFSQLRKPGGSRYAAILDAAGDAGVPIDSKTDMCNAGSDAPALVDACGAWKSGYNGFLAMSVLAGVFAVSTAVFTGLLVRERRSQRSLAQAWQRHQVQLGAGPRLGGATLTAGFNF